MSDYSSFILVAEILIAVGAGLYLYSIYYSMKHREEILYESYIDIFEQEVPLLLSAVHAKLAVENATSAFYHVFKRFARTYSLASYVIDEMATGKLLGDVLKEVGERYYMSPLIQLLYSAYHISNTAGSEVMQVIDTMVETGNKIIHFKEDINQYISEVSNNVRLILYAIIPLSTIFVMMLYQVYYSLITRQSPSALSFLSQFVNTNVPLTPVQLLWIKIFETMAIAIVFSVILSSLKAGAARRETLMREIFKTVGISMILLAVSVIVVVKLMEIVGW